MPHGVVYIYGFDPNCRRDVLDIGDIVIFTRYSDRLGLMRILMTGLGTNLRSRPD